MHHTLEIVMPPVPGVEMPTTEHIQECVSVIMAPFNEDPEIPEDEDEAAEIRYQMRNSFWDWWVIGGRFAGNKLMAALDQDKLNAFMEELTKRKVTVSGIQCGKQELSPASQIPMVDELWGEYFPEHKGQACPIFRHSNDAYGGTLPDDVLHFKDTPRSLKASRVIIAGPNHDNTKMEAHYMVSDDLYNGVNWVKTGWDGTLGEALNAFMEYAERWRDEFKEARIPTDNWLVVTVDYHS